MPRTVPGEVGRFALATAERGTSGFAFPDIALPEPEARPNLIYLEQTACHHCDGAIADDPTGTRDADRVDRWCPECGSRYYATPADEPNMRTREKLHARPWEWGSYEETEANRRRRYRIANLARTLNALSRESDQARGYGFEAAVGRLFKIEGLTYEAAYRRRGAQIDGALALDGWVYLVETRWRRGRASGQDLVTLRSKVRRSSRQTMGMFISVNGWTDGAVEALTSEADQALILVDGFDIGAVLLDTIRLAPLLRAKVRHLSLYGEPYLPVHRVASVPPDGVARPVTPEAPDVASGH